MNRPICLAIGAFLVLTIVFGDQTVSATAPITNWSPAEKFVLQRLHAGQPCDLSDCPSDDKPRLSSLFLATLLTRWADLWPTNNELPRAVSITHALIQGDIDLVNLEVPFEVWLLDCKFDGQVNFSKTVFRRSLNLSRTQFAARAGFNSIVVGRSDWSGSLYLDSAVFNGEMDLTDASIERNLFAGRTQFVCTTAGPRFAKLTVHGDAIFTGAVFASNAVFTQADIKRGFFASGAQFNSRDSVIQFDDLSVGDDASFNNCVFAGPVDFTDTQVKGDLQAGSAEFQNAERGVSFKSLKVDGSVLFSGTTFSGPADFTHAQVGVDLDFKAASFLRPSTTNVFREIKIDGVANFEQATFAGLADFHAGRFGNELHLDAAHFKGQPQSALFERMSVAGPATLVGADFAGHVSFDHSTFLTLDLKSVTWPLNPNDSWLSLDGLKYERISAGSDEQSWRHLIDLLRHAAYNANSYVALESFYQRIGYPALADEVFFAQKKRERTDPLLHTSRGTRAWSLFLDGFVRYGRAPWMAFLWSLIVVLLGSLVFDHHYMESQDSSKPIRKYNRFWYSLDLFAPVIDLQAASVWKPKSQCPPFLHHYFRMHRILGWVLVPIGAAAVTGLTK